MGDETLIGRPFSAFVEDLDERCRAFNRDLLALERHLAGGEREELLRSILRTVHGLSGVTGPFQVGLLEDMRVRLETLINATLLGRLPLDFALLSLLSSALDALKESVIRLHERHNLGEGAIASLISRLDEAIEGLDGRPGEPNDSVSAAASSSPMAGAPGPCDAPEDTAHRSASMPPGAEGLAAVQCPLCNHEISQGVRLNRSTLLPLIYSRLIVALVHDLRTPLNVAGLSLRMLTHAQLDPESAEDVMFADESFRRAEQFISAIQRTALMFQDKYMLNENIELIEIHDELNNIYKCDFKILVDDNSVHDLKYDSHSYYLFLVPLTQELLRAVARAPDPEVSVHYATSTGHLVGRAVMPAEAVLDRHKWRDTPFMVAKSFGATIDLVRIGDVSEVRWTFPAYN